MSVVFRPVHSSLDHTARPDELNIYVRASLRKTSMPRSMVVSDAA